MQVRKLIELLAQAEPLADVEVIAEGSRHSIDGVAVSGGGATVYLNLTPEPQAEPALKQTLTDSQAEKLGQRLIEVLNLRVKNNGRVDTAWGDKTMTGLGHVAARLIEESSEEPARMLPFVQTSHVEGNPQN